MNKKIQDSAFTYKSLLWILLMSIIAFFCFYRLGQYPLYSWDEARHGISAYEMLKNGNLILNTYQYRPDYYNLKPPVSFWFIILGYQFFGFNLIGLRFFSALSFFMTAILCALFAHRRYGYWQGLTVLLLFSCCTPFYRYHFARNGDADALFTFFAVISLLAMFLLEKHPPALYVCCAAFSLAFLTKSWSAL